MELIKYFNNDVNDIKLMEYLISKNVDINKEKNAS